MTAGGARLEAAGVGRRAPESDAWLLRDVSLVLGGGDRIAVVGPSGAGKSLLLRALALLDPVEAGEVRWNGRVPADADVPTYRRQVVYLHQRPVLFEGTVEAGLRRPFTFAAAGRAYDPARALGMLAAVGRDRDFLARSTADLSGGEAQIVAFVRALQLEPEVLLLDEPTAALDREAEAAIEELVSGWRAEGAGRRALVWASHDRTQAERVADRVLRLRAGRIEP